MADMTVMKSHDDWLERRAKTIGGSDASCVIGKNPWKSNVQLWKEKTGKAKPKDVSHNPLVQYGTNAEAPLRELFALDYPELKVEYEPNNIWTNEKYPFAHASLDGWFTDPNGRKGGLEIKTTLVIASSKKEEWKDRIPDNYFTQVVHSLMVTDFDVWCLKAQLKWVFPNDDNNVYLQTRHYWIERADVLEDIEYLAKAEQEFWQNVQSGKPVHEILPEL